MKEELLIIIKDFKRDIYDYNSNRRPVLEDFKELSFENFIKWLEYNE